MQRENDLAMAKRTIFALTAALSGTIWTAETWVHRCSRTVFDPTTRFGRVGLHGEPYFPVGSAPSRPVRDRRPPSAGRHDRFGLRSGLLHHIVNLGTVEIVVV